MDINETLEEGMKICYGAFWLIAVIILGIIFSPIWIPAYIIIFIVGLIRKGIIQFNKR